MARGFSDDFLTGERSLFSGDCFTGIAVEFESLSLKSQTVESIILAAAEGGGGRIDFFFLRDFFLSFVGVLWTFLSRRRPSSV